MKTDLDRADTCPTDYTVVVRFCVYTDVVYLVFMVDGRLTWRELVEIDARYPFFETAHLGHLSFSHPRGSS